MLQSAVPSSASTYTEHQPATPTSPSRPSRLRGLSYLRTHLHSSRPSQTDAAPPLNRSTSSPGLTNATASAAERTTPVRSNTSDEEERGSGAPNTSGPLSSRLESNESGWIPTIQGRSGLSRESLHPTSTSTTSARPEPNSTSTMMTRSRAASALGPTPTSTHPANRRSSALEAALSNDPFATTEPASSTTPGPSRQLPSIRFIPHVEPRSSRPSLQFTALSRTLKTPHSVVRVGRYSERDNHTGAVDTHPVGFKSKVVSRRHCEFWCTEGQWYVKDVKSSSGTFLNHVRLSSPGVESRPYPVNDGDVVQLGIDFKGGEEVIFRCVKIRVECNRGWQKQLNSFNTSAHKRLIKSSVKAKARDSDAASVNSSECSICLNPVAPCQALFVAPCSHVWHYKCVRNLIHSPQWPNFLCPNCRFVADLEADVEQPDEEELEQDSVEQDFDQANATPEPSGSSDDSAGQNQSDDGDELAQSNTAPRLDHISRDDADAEDLAQLLSQTVLATPSPLPSTTTEQAASDEQPTRAQPIAIAKSASRTPSDPFGARSTTPTSHAQFALAAGPIADGPMTPRNDAGPFVLDGSAGRDRRDGNIPQPVAEVSEPASLESTGRSSPT